MTPEEPLVLWQHGPVERTEYRIGCSSWLDTSLLASGLFYPDRRMTSEERLQWYARCFDCVEVNATYYALPSLRTSQLWAERTPAGFEFAIKAYGLLTGHNPKADRLPKLLRELLPQPLPVDQRGETERKHFPQEAYDLCFEMFHDALTPLAQAGKLSYVLFQFAPWIGWTEKTQEYLASLPAKLGGLADTVQKMRGKVRRVYAKFNNNFRDYPIVNALQFRKRLGQEAPDPEALKATWPPSRRVPRPGPADDDLRLFR